MLLAGPLTHTQTHMHERGKHIECERVDVHNADATQQQQLYGACLRVAVYGDDDTPLSKRSAFPWHAPCFNLSILFDK